MSLTFQEAEERRRTLAAQRSAQAHALAARFGARIFPQGQAWRVVGPTVNVLIADLGLLREADFVAD